MITITVVAENEDLFSAYIDDQLLVESSRYPFFAAARELLKKRVDPATPIQMKHKGNETIVLSWTVGKAAQAKISEGNRRPYIGKFKPYNPPEVQGASVSKGQA